MLLTAYIDQQFFCIPQQNLTPVANVQIQSKFLDLCLSSLHEGHANLLCIIPILTDVPKVTEVLQACWPCADLYAQEPRAG